MFNKNNSNKKAFMYILNNEKKQSTDNSGSKRNILFLKLYPQPLSCNWIIKPKIEKRYKTLLLRVKSGSGTSVMMKMIIVPMLKLMTTVNVTALSSCTH